jgi:hypothetical protein
MRRIPSSRITAGSYAKHGSYARQLGTVLATRWLVPSWCCRPSPASVVRPAVAPSMKPRERESAAAQIASPTRWKPIIE